MLFFIRTAVQTKSAKASLLTILAVMPSLHTKPMDVVSTTLVSTIPITLKVPKEDNPFNNTICCTKADEHNVSHHDDCLENHRRYNRRLLKRRKDNEHYYNGDEKRVFDMRRALHTGDDRRGGTTIHRHYCHFRSEH